MASSNSPHSAHAAASVSRKLGSAHSVSSHARVAHSRARAPFRTSGSGHVAQIHANWLNVEELRGSRFSASVWSRMAAAYFLSA